MIADNNLLERRDMIDIRALETFQKLAGWLTPLFFTAALMAHCQMLDERYIPSAEGVAGYFRDGSSLSLASQAWCVCWQGYSLLRLS
jgi:hypothetical protein